ncbi:MAG: hypothetical protein M0029_05705 [Actinomycetota bacterium]|nr:hypothetical protein [Actinomycetota bacterium]
MALTAGTAWAAGPPTPGPQLAFDAPQQQASLVIPAPACPTSNPGCEWMLFMNAPLVPNAPVIGEVTGTSGRLTIPYPTDFCGVIQADALIGRAPFVGAAAWTYVSGMRTSISTCQSGSGGGTGPNGGGTGPNGGGTGPNGGGTGPNGGGTGPNGGGTGPNALSLQSTSLPFTASASPTGGTGGTVPSQLPFTGSNLPPILVAAAGSLVAGLVLTGADRWVLRAVGRHPAAVDVPVRGAGRVAGWLTGR